MEQSVPEALFTTDSTERGPGNAVDTGAASAERRSPRRKACPTTVSNIEELLSMRSSLSESRVSAFPRFLGSKGLPEHRRPLAREGSPGVSSIQSQEDRRLRCRRASSRRDPHVRGQQKDTELGLRYDRGLVSALAIDGDGKTKLPEHSRSVSRPFEADEFRTSSPDRHGWIRILPEGHPSLLRTSVSLRPGPQDAQERSYHQGRTESAAQSRVAIRRRAQ